MNNEKQKEWLKDIQMKKMEVKSQLKKLSFLLEQNIIFKEEMDALLDRLRMLEELENEIRKMK
jgi:Trp operon repressor